MDIVIFCGLPVRAQNFLSGNMPPIDMTRFVASNDEVSGPPPSSRPRLVLVP